MFGWTAQEAVGSFLPIIPDDKQDEFAEFRRRVMGGESLSGLELMPRKKDGSPVTVNAFAAPLRGAAGRVTGVLALIEDVTGMKRLQQQFFQARKMEAVGRLAAGVAHDFNNLLTAILASTDLLLETLSPGHPGREDAEETRKAALRAADLIRQLLAFSRQQAWWLTEDGFFLRDLLVMAHAPLGTVPRGEKGRRWIGVLQVVSVPNLLRSEPEWRTFWILGKASAASVLHRGAPKDR